AQVIELLCRYEVLVEFAALDMARHADDLVRDFKIRQGDALTEHITPAHRPEIVRQLGDLRGAIHGMPNQLFLQALLTVELILETVQHATLYFVQRRPEELGDIVWIVDRKNRSITEMENAWSTLILPWGEAHFAKKPMKVIRGADYSHFSRYEINAGDAEMAQHMEWTRETYGLKEKPAGPIALDAARLFTEKLDFVDSRVSLGVQLSDMLASILRRALNNSLRIAGWHNFGSLLVHKAGSRFIQLGTSDTDQPTPHVAAVWNTLQRKSKSMLV